MLALHFMSTEEDDNPVYAEAFDQALNGWLTMLSSPEHLPPYYGSYSNQVCRHSVAIIPLFTVAAGGRFTPQSDRRPCHPFLFLFAFVSSKAFQKYVESRMAKAKRDAMHEEEVEEETLPDEIRYRDQLTGALRRRRVEGQYLCFSVFQEKGSGAQFHAPSHHTPACRRRCSWSR
jgi:hypothetical protein